MSKNGHTDKDHKLDVVMIVGGAPYSFSFAVGRNIGSIIEETLKETKNTAQPPENWELRDENGTLLDLGKHLREYGFHDGVKLFLTVKAGIGGGTCHRLCS
jgi:hypothetical protein